ncbi:MAG: hypothetical protein H6720_12475 [Sandaracinus sp.]|nr:hypothetical protein [Sandaracinus sp.]
MRPPRTSTSPERWLKQLKKRPMRGSSARCTAIALMVPIRPSTPTPSLR